MGYRYNIISKIIPMFEWRKLFMELVGDEQKAYYCCAYNTLRFF